MAQRKETKEEKIAAVKSWLPALKKQFPLSKPLRVRYLDECANGSQHGNCDVSKSGKSFIIELGLQNDIANMLAWLMHEWTHARIWELHPGHSVHPPEWGVQYARIWEFCIDHNFVAPIFVPGDSEAGESEA